jgi:hypothetical protein
MPIATAQTVKTPKGTTLDKLDTTKLRDYIILMQNVIRENHLTPEERTDKQYKLDAALTLWHDRLSQPA